MRLKESIHLIYTDYRRWYSKGSNVFFTTIVSFIKLYYLERGFRYGFWLRLSAVNGIVGVIPKIVLHHLQSKFGIIIHSSTEIGEGLYIGHGLGIVVHPKTHIGNNVNISQFLTIGSNNGTPAYIGDNVYIGPNVCIVENVKIGDGSIIGAGSVVTKDVPPHSVVVGNPAKIIKNL